MRTGLLHLNSTNENRYNMMGCAFKNGSTNRSELKKMSVFLNEIIKETLTDKQRTYLLLYVNGMQQKQIAHRFGVSESTVCRHIKAATIKLKRLAKFYQQ